jgi:hypothetical protein
MTFLGSVSARRLGSVDIFNQYRTHEGAKAAFAIHAVGITEVIRRWQQMARPAAELQPRSAIRSCLLLLSMAITH